MPEDYEILDPLPATQDESTTWKKYGPAIFWGTLVAIPVLNLGASFFDYRTAKINLELEKLKEVAEQAA